MSTASDVRLNGDLHVYPFDVERERLSILADHYADLAEDVAVNEILVLTQLVTDRDARARLSSSVKGPVEPEVQGLGDVALSVLERAAPSVDCLAENERIEILANFLDSHDWATPYLASAADQKSFQQDVGELLLKSDNQGGLDPTECSSEALAEIARVGEQFQSYLTEHGYVDQPTVVTRATQQLREMDPATAAEVVQDWQVLLVADYEELDPPKRQFLAALADTTDARIVALAEQHSRILSTWSEAGTITDLAAGLTVSHPASDTTPATTEPSAVARFFATGDLQATPPLDGTVSVIEAPTFTDQIGRVADEIERLCQTPEYVYGDIAVVFRDSKAPVGDTIRRLRRNGIPSTTTAVNQLGDDPAVRELHLVTKRCASAGDDTDESAVPGGELVSEIPDVESVLADVEAAPTPATGLWQWVHDTQLKERIASEYGEIEARNQFSNVQEAIELALFLDAAPELEATWDRYLTALERAFRYASTRYEAVAAETDQGGVAVSTTYGMKNESRKAVFMLNVTDDEYPFAPDLTALLPQTRLRSETDFPTLTAQSTADVRATFPTGPNPDDDSFYDYFGQLSRRLLAIGARAATDRLYFGVPRESSSSLGEYNQPSRYLSLLVDAVEFVTPLDDTEVELTSRGQLNEFTVERLDETLKTVRRAAVGGDTVDLDTYEQELGAIQALLRESETEALQQALETRVDLRHGRVRRE